MTDLARTHGAETTMRPAPLSGGGSAGRGTLVWYGDASGGFYLNSLDGWNPRLAFLVFPRITSSSRIDRCNTDHVALQRSTISTLPIARQVRELQAALSINKSELARILGVSRPTVYDWLDGGEPNADNRSRIRMLLGLLSESQVSSNNPLFPRFVRSRLEPGNQILLKLLSEDTIDEATAKNLIQKAKALGDEIDAQREEREARLRDAGFEEPDAEQRKANLARNVALLAWPRQ